jgi:hypothetical protein
MLVEHYLLPSIGSPFDGKLRDESLDPEIFCTLREAEVFIERWRKEYNTFRDHSSLRCRPPAPEAVFKTCIVQNRTDMLSSQNGVRTQKSLTYKVTQILGAGQNNWRC